MSIKTMEEDVMEEEDVSLEYAPGTVIRYYYDPYSVRYNPARGRECVNRKEEYEHYTIIQLKTGEVLQVRRPSFDTCLEKMTYQTINSFRDSMVYSGLHVWKIYINTKKQ